METEDKEAESRGAMSIGNGFAEVLLASGEGGESGPSISNSEMLLACHPRQLGGQMSGDRVCTSCAADLNSVELVHISMNIVFALRNIISTAKMK